MKDRTAGIELEAHCRAQAVQAEAEERIRKTRAEVEQWLNRVQGNYGRLRADMDAAVSRACGELDRCGRRWSRSPGSWPARMRDWTS